MYRHETMAGNAENGDESLNPVRVAAWSAAVLLLLLPFIAMQLTDEVNWTAGDFVFAGALILGVGIPLELAVRATRDNAYRFAVGFAVGAAFLITWLTGAVGIIGSENNPANLMYAGVLAVGVSGSVIALFRPRGMAFTMAATALAQATVTVIALVTQWGSPWNEPLKTICLNAFFLAMFVASARLFHHSAAVRDGRGGA